MAERIAKVSRETAHRTGRAGVAAVAAALFLVAATAVPATAASADPAVVQGQATRLYSAYFLRSPDLAGLRYWVGKLSTGTSLAGASQYFSESSEFQRRYGALSDAQFVDLVYRNVLGRAPDAAGRSHWVSVLATHRSTRGGVMVGFSESNEFVRKTGTTPPSPRSFGDGMNTNVAGTWRNVTNANSCYWARLRGFSGGLGDIIANDFVDTPGRSIVTIKAGDAGFESTRCGRWVPDIGPITLAPTLPFVDGTYRVGRDVAPGTWRVTGARDCYWERLKGFSGEFADLDANDLGDGTRMVTIAATDVGFSSTRCGTWTKVG